MRITSEQIAMLKRLRRAALDGQFAVAQLREEIVTRERQAEAECLLVGMAVREAVEIIGIEAVMKDWQLTRSEARGYLAAVRKTKGGNIEHTG